MALTPEITHADLFRLLGQAVAEAEAWKQHAVRLAQELSAVPAHVGTASETPNEPAPFNGRKLKGVQ